MATFHIEPVLERAERHAILAVVRAHPEWTLAQLVEQLGGPRGDALAKLTIREIIDGDGLIAISPATDGGPPIDQGRLARASEANGEDFDQLVFEVIRAAGRPVSATYLRARVGGPRWKLQASCRRLADADRIRRSGVTSSTRYRVA